VWQASHSAFIGIGNPGPGCHRPPTTGGRQGCNGTRAFASATSEHFTNTDRVTPRSGSAGSSPRRFLAGRLAPQRRVLPHRQPAPRPPGINHRPARSTVEEELLYFEGAGALAQAAQGGCGVSFSGDIPAPPGRGAVQPAVGDPASAGGLD